MCAVGRQSKAVLYDDGEQNAGRTRQTENTREMQRQSRNVMYDRKREEVGEKEEGYRSGVREAISVNNSVPSTREHSSKVCLKTD